jgi:hypothetical protein
MLIMALINNWKMKKNILFAIVLFATSATMMSCKKDYKCECSKAYTTGSGTNTRDYSEYTYTENRKRAEDRCNDNTKTGSDIFGDYSINCQIQ